LAIKPSNEDAFFREVDEELRRDQMRTVWQRFRWAIVGALALLLAGIGGFIWWQNHRLAKAGEQGEALVAALDSLEQGNAGNVASQLDPLTESGTDGYRAAALFARADAAIQTGNVASAVAILRGIAADDGLDEPYRNAALVRQTALEFDRLSPAAVAARLTPLARPGNPWFGSAGEMLAIAHLRQNRPNLAAPIFSAIARDETVPDSIRSRAVQMAGALGVDAVQQSAATGAATPPPAKAQ